MKLTNQYKDAFVKHVFAVSYVESVVRVLGIKWTQLECETDLVGQSYKWKQWVYKESAIYMDQKFIDAATNHLKNVEAHLDLHKAQLLCATTFFDCYATLCSTTYCYLHRLTKDELIQVTDSILKSNTPADLVHFYIFNGFDEEEA